MKTDKENRMTRIFTLFARKRYSPEVEEETQRWLIGEEDSEEKRDASFRFWNTIKAPGDEGMEDALDRVNREIGASKQQMSLTRRIVYVAAVFTGLFVLATGLMFFVNTGQQESAVVTANGETQQAVLPDGSVVRLQPGSKLTYKNGFEQDKRVLQLAGEAYFSVAHEQDRPFVVEAGKLNVQVTGTEFTLRSYPGDDRIVATLIRGQIAVDTGKGEKTVLAPGEQFVFNRLTGESVVSKLAPEDIAVTKEGGLYFDNVTLTEILRSIERQYNVRIKQSPGKLRNRYTIRLHNEDGLDEILEMLDETVDEYTFVRKGDEVILKKSIE